MLRKSSKRSVAGLASMSVRDVNDHPVNLCINHKKILMNMILIETHPLQVIKLNPFFKRFIFQ